jgi:hypothetical protein
VNVIEKLSAAIEVNYLMFRLNLNNLIRVTLTQCDLISKDDRVPLSLNGNELNYS